MAPSAAEAAAAAGIEAGLIRPTPFGRAPSSVILLYSTVLYITVVAKKDTRKTFS